MLLVMRVLSIVPLNFKVSYRLHDSFRHKNLSSGQQRYQTCLFCLPLPFTLYICVSVLRWRTTDPDVFYFWLCPRSVPLACIPSSRCAMSMIIAMAKYWIFWTAFEFSTRPDLP